MTGPDASYKIKNNLNLDLFLQFKSYPWGYDRRDFFQVREENVSGDVPGGRALVPPAAVAVALADQGVSAVHAGQNGMGVSLEPGEQLGFFPHRPAPGHVELH